MRSAIVDWRRSIMMNFRMPGVAFLACALVFAGPPALAEDAPASNVDSAAAITSKVAASCVATFHCLSIYWSPQNGQAEKNVQVKFRAVADKTWHDGLPMRYNP